MELPLSEIYEGGAQIRLRENEDTIEIYKGLMADGYGSFPPVAVVKIDNRYTIADGHHRVRAARRAGIASIPIEVVGHSFEEALEYAIRVNSRNGLALTLADRQNMRRRAILEVPNKTAKYLAELCGCSVMTILRDMAALEEEGVYKRPEKVARKNGRIVKTKQPRKRSKITNVNIDAFSPKAPVSSDPPKIEYVTCKQCGFRAPLEMLDAPDSTWEKRDFNAKTMQYESLFCCMECLTKWESRSGTPQNAPETAFEEKVGKIPQENTSGPQTQNLRPSRVVSFEFEVPEAVSDDELEELLIHTFIEDGRGIKIFSRARINNINNINLKKNINNINAECSDLKTEFAWELNDGTEYYLPREKYEQYKRCFPGIDLDTELLKCIAWGISNPKNRKTRSGILKHINNWLGNAQNSSRPARVNQNSKSPYQAAHVTFEDIPY